MTYAEEYKDIVKAGRKESKDLGQKAQNAVIDTFALMDKADAEIARLNALLAEAREERVEAAKRLSAQAARWRDDFIADSELIDAINGELDAALAKLGA